MKERGIKPVIPPKSNRTATIRFSKRLYRQRNYIEQVLGHLNRSIATRYDQLAESFLGMLFIASVRYRVKFVHATSIRDRLVTSIASSRMLPALPDRAGRRDCESIFSAGRPQRSCAKLHPQLPSRRLSTGTALADMPK